jgi:hypothetical protein
MGAAAPRARAACSEVQEKEFGSQRTSIAPSRVTLLACPER